MTASNKTSTEMATFVEEAWLGLGDTANIRFPDLFKVDEADLEHWGITPLRIMNNPEYIAYACKTLLNVGLLPIQSVIIQEMWTRTFPMYLASRGFGKSYLMAVYCLLKMILTPPAKTGGAGVKIVIVGAAFRQSKVIFEYMETIWNNSPRLRSVCKGHNQGPRRDVDRCTFRIGENTCVAIPIGDGSKIRGLRANIILGDEFNSIPPDIYETVIQGFAAVAANPVSNVKTEAKIKSLAELGLEYTPSADEMPQGNQAILSGTCGYDFQHFAGYWKKYKTIINSCGEADKLREIYPEGIPDGFNWEDYCVIRIPCELVPKGFMDATMLARAKATTHTGLFQMEYGACHKFDTPIITKNGIKKIVDVQVGDEVLTHKGRFRKVLKRMYRSYNGLMCKINSYGCYKPIFVTPEHPFWIGEDDFEESQYVENALNLSKLKILEGKTELDVRNIVSNFLEGDDFIYPTPSSLKISKEKRQEIKDNVNSGLSVKEVSKIFNVKENTIRYIINDKRKPKNSLPKIIKLDRYFGKCVGYYVSEGSIGANGRACSFALDGHVDKGLEFFIKELTYSLDKAIGLKPKTYKNNDNVHNICINSRIFAELISKICPGNCYEKIVSHDILFSNEDFLFGFIIGMWNGDGHISKEFATIQLTNKNLIGQIKLALSYFNINCSFIKPKIKPYAIIKGKAVNQTQVWRLNISGEDFRKFLNTFYNKDLEVKQNLNKNKIYLNGDSCVYKIKSKTYEQYDGYVYNLEVEDDNSYSLPNATVHNCFSKDSNGFFKRSIIERCVAKEDNTDKESWPIWCPQPFDAMVRGNPKKEYVYGIDPASEVDNFSIIILELCENHARVVYSWTTNRRDHIKRKKAGFTDENDFYAYCARKIRELMLVFPAKKIGLDAQGGGIAVMESLHNKNNLKAGDVPIWPIIDDDKPSETDNEPGLHILELVQFARYEWLSEANHGLRKDMEDKFLLFPRFDPVSLEMAVADDFRREMEFKNKYPDKKLVLFDTLEDCVMEIEELKNELTTIILTKTGTGVNSRDRWDTPEIKTETGKKGRLRKDRYSSLLIANMLARQFRKELTQVTYDAIGGYIEEIDSSLNGDFYEHAPEWYKSKANDFYKHL